MTAIFLALRREHWAARICGSDSRRPSGSFTSMRRRGRIDAGADFLGQRDEQFASAVSTSRTEVPVVVTSLTRPTSAPESSQTSQPIKSVT